MKSRVKALTVVSGVVGSLFFANGVFAQDCATLTEELSAKIAEMADADPAKMTMVQELADKAMAAKDGGDEGACLAAVQEAMALLDAQ